MTLLLLVGLPVWADPLQVREGTLTDVAGAVHFVQGGAYLPSPDLVATGKELAALRAENAELKAAPVATPSSVLVVGLMCLAAGAVGGAVFVWRLK